MSLLGVLTYFIAAHVICDVFSGCFGVNIPYCCIRYRWCIFWACWHASLLYTLQLMCFLDVLVLTYLTAVHITRDVFSGRVDTPYCCIRYRWCIFWVCWHTSLLYTLQVMYFLGVLTHPIAVYLTGDVLSGRIDTPHCCTRYRWCIFWACWHTALLYTLQLMCFLVVLVLTYLIAVDVTGNVFPWRVGVDIPHCCTAYK